jgi:hypothetical protein
MQRRRDRVPERMEHEPPAVEREAPAQPSEMLGRLPRAGLNPDGGLKEGRELFRAVYAAFELLNRDGPLLAGGLA